MKISSLPFILVILSSLLPMVGSYLDIPMYHIPAGLFMVAMALVYVSKKRLILHNIPITWAGCILFMILVVQIITGRGFVSLATGGYVLIFACLFYNLFTYGTGISINKIVRGVSYIYKFFIVGMIIEFIIIMLGKQYLLRELFIYSSPSYKTYNSADVLRYFGLFQQAGGLNSVLLGSQIAGMLSLFSTFWFLGIWKSKLRGPAAEHSVFWLLLSFMMFLMTVNGTVFLLAVITLGMYGIFMNKKNKLLIFCAFIICIVILGYMVSEGYILTRVCNQNLVKVERLDPRIQDEVRGMTFLQYYVFEFFVPIKLFISSNWIDRLMGVGAQYLRSTSVYLSGDFGFGAALFSSGLVWMTTFVATLCITCIPALKPPLSGLHDLQPWSVLGSVNGLITLLWLLSTLHYNQAFSNPGGMVLFALHLALTVYCCKQVKPYLMDSQQMGMSYGSGLAPDPARRD